MADQSLAIEVHLQGISFSTNKHQVVAELAKILHREPYAAFSTVLGPTNFHVYLFNDARGGGRPHSGSGSLTLLKNVGLHFLQEYGERPDGRPPPKPFHIGGRRVKFSMGRRKPRQDVVERILRFPYADPMAAKEKEGRTHIFETESIILRTLQFGWSCRDSVFSVEWESNITGTLKFNDERRELRISISRPNETLFVAIRLSRIQYVQLTSDLSTNAPVIFLSLSDPPTFEAETQGSATRQRLSSLPISNHAAVAPFTSLAIRLICSNRGDLNRFQRLAKTAGIHNIYDSELYTEHRKLFSPEVLARVQEAIKKLRWTVAFQVEALFRNLNLDATEVLEILPLVRQLAKAKGRSYTTLFLRHFATRARSWTFDTETSQTVTRFFSQSETEYAGCPAKAPSLDPTDTSIFQSLHVVISPTTIYLEGPFRSNRVIRSFHSQSHDSFLRVSFVDEGGLQYRWDRELDCVAFTRRRVGEFLIDKGLTIAGRHFDFLAYSQSALKEHAVWFVRPFLDVDGERTMVNAQSIIDNLGSFDGLEFDPKLRYCPARYAARISQAFTATDSTSVEVEEILQLPDISTPSGEYVFTDGVGTMSLELAEAIWVQLRSSKRRNRRVKNHPRALQIRFQGSKGMLSVDYRLKGHVFCLRPSMIKFAAPHSQTIEIARAFDRHGPYYLNRPLIMLLEGLGVPFETFKELQDKAVHEAQASTRSLKNFSRMLEVHGLGSSFRLPSVLSGLTQLGIDTLIGNSFYKKMLDYAVHHVLRLLKNKARIPVGVADVHKYLKEGEIFVCTREPDSNRLHYIEGDVLISRSPTIHPGDVQLVKAIGKPPPGSCFAHEPLPNTVVFSVVGLRPLPSCCGGGDLDGDTYNIIPLNKCPEFLPTQTYQPGKYTPAPKKLVDHPSTMVDVAEFVIEYINSHVLGMVATNWLLIADQSPRGILDPDCMKLAALHSDAVDYPKSGQPVAMNTIPKPKSNLKPDWHAPEVNVDLADYYPSERAIGKLFRAIQLPQIQPGTVSSFERRMKKAGRLRAQDVDNLASTFDGLGFNDNDPIVLAIEGAVHKFIPTEERHQTTVTYIAQIFSRYASELQAIAVACTLSHARTALLSEEEVVVGTIVARSSQPRKRQDLIANLREKSDFLVRGVREELLGDDDVTWEECLQRAWLAFQLAIGEGKSFGAQSFIWIALGELNDESKASRSRRF
ncbi:RNA-directed RNA polymerase 2 [Mycena belliarum]|uniref:RNA-dependent RNA polymerase n=1 Tax=Mycena belliarum TaxID=1033014 RepID=A0AAD6XWY3_9AGAR|nr:RNA-directed RNA polymerase 2 [Mycena belliae]